MNMRPFIAGLLGALLIPVCQAQTRELNLYTFEAPPYQVTDAISPDLRRQVAGETVETIACAAGQAGWSANIRVTPPKRAIHSLRRNRVDGYFAIDPSAKLDTTARRSAPVAMAKWYFFTVDPELDTRLARIGVVDGSSEESWLMANGYEIFLTVASPGQLLALLERNRIDAAVMDERVMAGLKTDNDGAREKLHKRFLRHAPLYLYLSNGFTRENPGFLSRFNRYLADCRGGQIS
ncbi:transporter substrate-binding domain-containing protein [Marinobacter sp. M216]|uniref:Transporter substrate-binding domain-containing protein n=1 Tax=Marinobacter albus TaxID=3030833 RepID=A0ABT7H8P4_9GAMM|nr:MULTISPECIES: transporter substrate-binding domain-containing protein [unclassified Marinobacter]MBW7470992.1 transporter substrate-binding domain-containing protein [Marinobacter sp. F4218]MDK9556728.1 transporter substrate-binding domain-containing protein [Marinobacter sp. M216]